MTVRFLTLLLFSGIVASATTYALRTLDQRWPDVDIVAVVNVAEVHAVTTPEGITLQSAEATLEKVIYRRFEPIDQINQSKIKVYSLLPNGLDQGGVSIASGRTFVMMKQKGVDTFFPTDPWDFQSLSTDEVLWPTKDGIQKKPIADVVQEVEDHISTLGNERKR